MEEAVTFNRLLGEDHSRPQEVREQAMCTSVEKRPRAEETAFAEAPRWEW